VSAIARTHRIDASQLFAWRRKALSSGAVRPINEEPYASAEGRAIVGGRPEQGSIKMERPGQAAFAAPLSWHGPPALE